MNIQTVIVLIALSVIGGYLFGVLDGRFTNRLMKGIKEKQDERLSPSFHMDLHDDGSLHFYVGDKEVKRSSEIPNNIHKGLSGAPDSIKALLLDNHSDEIGAEQQTDSLPHSNIPLGHDRQQELGSRIPKSQAVASIPKHPQTLAELIDDQVQRRVESDGITTLVKIETKPDKSIVFRVGNDVYDDFEKIKNERVRTLVRQVIQEWRGK